MTQKHLCRAQGLKKVKDTTWRHATARPEEVLTGSKKGGQNKKSEKAKAADSDLKFTNPLHSNEELGEGD